MADSRVNERWNPIDHDRVNGSLMSGSKMASVFETLARIGYTAVRGTHAAVTAPSGQVRGGPRRESSRRRIGQDSPGFTRLPLATLRFAAVVPPGFAP